jgi:hypothetical protein
VRTQKVKLKSGKFVDADLDTLVCWNDWFIINIVNGEWLVHSDRELGKFHFFKTKELAVKFVATMDVFSA